jgi:hypothetical protein
MDTKEIVKYAVIAAAVYVAYEYWRKHMMLLGTGGGADGTGSQKGTSQTVAPSRELPPAQPAQAPSPAQDPSAQAPSPAQAPYVPRNVYPISIPTGAPPPVTEADLIVWASDQSAAAYAPANVMYTADQWNYYRQKGGHATMDALAFPGVTRDNRSTYRMNAQTYWQTMTATGMSGLGLGSVHQYGWLA